MKALVVYESMFGNTRTVARAVAGALVPAMEVELKEVSRAPQDVPADVDLLVVGAPTHAFSLSRRNSRVEAHRRGATSGDEEVGLREWLGTVRLQGPTAVATFDTRVGMVRHLPGSAAHRAARIARGRDIGRAIGSESFFVRDVAGPLLSGELERARAWGHTLSKHMSAARGLAGAAAEERDVD